MPDNDKPWWYPVLIDDPPEGMADRRRYVAPIRWDNLFDAERDYEALADAYLRLEAEAVKLRERIDGIAQGLADAGHCVSNSNGSLPLRALGQLIAERNKLSLVAAAAKASVQNPAWAGVCDEDIDLEQALRDAGIMED